jgi:aldose 1-epimerase
VIDLEHGDIRVVVDPENGGRVVSFSVDEVHLLRTPEDDPGGTHWGAFVMAPWAGRTRHGRFTFDGVEHQLEINSGAHSIHGTVRQQAWTVESLEADRICMRCDFGPAWPFGGWAEQVIAVHHDGVELELSMHADDRPTPVVGGWHPWWQRRLAVGAPDAELELPAASMYIRDAEGIAVPEQQSPPPPGPWDDCFTDLSGPPVLRWPDGPDLAIESNCPCVVVYDEPVDAICVEPQSGPPDALNHDPAVAEPSRPVVVHSMWRVRT